MRIHVFASVARGYRAHGIVGGDDGDDVGSFALELVEFLNIRPASPVFEVMGTIGGRTHGKWFA